MNTPANYEDTTRTAEVPDMDLTGGVLSPEEITRILAEETARGVRDDLQADRAYPAPVTKPVRKMREDYGWVRETLAPEERHFMLKAVEIWSREFPEVARELKIRLGNLFSSLNPEEFRGNVLCEGRSSLSRWMRQMNLSAEIKRDFLTLVSFCKGTILQYRAGLIPASYLLFLPGCSGVEAMAGAGVKTTSSSSSSGSGSLSTCSSVAGISTIYFIYKLLRNNRK